MIMDPGKVYLYSYKHTKLNEFLTCQPSELPPDMFASAAERFIYMNKAKAEEQHLNETRLFFVGTFDKKTGETVPTCQEILDCLEVYNRE